MDGGRGDENGEQGGWWRSSRRGRGPQGRMSSCLANERLAVEAPSSLLTSSFVHQPSHSPPIPSLEHIISRLRNRKQYCRCLVSFRSHF